MFFATLPNIFSALCLNTRGLENFMEYKPFDRLFRVLLSPEYLPAMRRRRRGTDTIYSTTLSLGNAVDELMRHQVSLLTEAMQSIITLLEQLFELGNNPKYCCQKPYSSSFTTTNKLTDTIRIQHRTIRATNTINTNTQGNDRNSLDDEYDNDEAPLANRTVPPLTTTTTATSARGTSETRKNISIMFNQTL